MYYLPVGKALFPFSYVVKNSIVEKTFATFHITYLYNRDLNHLLYHFMKKKEIEVVFFLQTKEKKQDSYTKDILYLTLKRYRYSVTFHIRLPFSKEGWVWLKPLEMITKSNETLPFTYDIYFEQDEETNEEIKYIGEALLLFITTHLLISRERITCDYHLQYLIEGFPPEYYVDAYKKREQESLSLLQYY